VDVASVGMQIEDRIVNQLFRIVICHVIILFRFEDFDIFVLECFGRRDDMRSIAAGLHVKCNDWGVF